MLLAVIRKWLTFDAAGLVHTYTQRSNVFGENVTTSNGVWVQLILLDNSQLPQVRTEFMKSCVFVTRYQKKNIPVFLMCPCQKMHKQCVCSSVCSIAESTDVISINYALYRSNFLLSPNRAYRAYRPTNIIIHLINIYSFYLKIVTMINI